MEERKNYWFPAKPPEYGWGWGLPVAWQGWVVYLLFLVLLVGGIAVLAQYGHSVFTALWGVFVALLLVAVCFWKGEPPGPFIGRTPGNPRQKPKLK
jgi:hypothetical protein